MAIQTAETDLINGIKNGTIDPVQMEDMVRNTNLAQPAKDHLINTIRSVKPDSVVKSGSGTPSPVEPLQEPEKQTDVATPELLPTDPISVDASIPTDVKVPNSEIAPIAKEVTPELLQRPVSPVAGIKGGSFFFSEPAMNFFDAVTVNNKQPLKKEKAAQLGYSVAVLRGQDAEDMKSIAADVAADLGTIGTSSYVESLKRDLDAEEQKATYESLWQNIPFLNAAAEDPMYAKELEAEANAAMNEVRIKNDTARLVSETVAKLTPDQKRLFERFDFITDEVMIQQSLDQMLTRKMNEDVENATLWNWVASFGPQTPLTSRADQQTLKELIASRVGIDPSNYVFKSDDAEAVREYFTDRNLTVGQLRERLEQYQAVMDEMDNEQLGVNPLYSAEGVELVLDGLRNTDDSVSLGNIYDAVDATILGADVRGAMKLVGRLADSISVRVLGQVGAASKVATAEQHAQINELIHKAVKDFSEVKDSGLLTQVPEATPVGKSQRQQVLEEKLAKLEQASSSNRRPNEKPVLKNGSPVFVNSEKAPKAFSPLVRMEHGEPISIIAKASDGSELGRLTFMPNGGPIDVFVKEDFRRQGVATILYDELERLGGKLPPVESGVAISKDAEAFRANRLKASKRESVPYGPVSRVERKQLEEQKKKLGDELAKIESTDKKALTKQYQDEGMKRKDAANRATEEISQKAAAKRAELDRLQADIDLVDSVAANKAEASRVRQELSTMSAVPLARNKLSVSVSDAITNRGSTLDTLVAESPVVARRVVSNMVRKDPEAVENLGVTAENLAERVIPTPEDGLGIHPGVLTGANHVTERLVKQFNEELDNLNPGDLLLKDEAEAIALEWAARVSKNTQGTLFSTHSSVDRIDDNGDFVVRGVFGADVDGGYSSREAAEAVVERVFGGEGFIKVREKGSNAPLTYADPEIVGPRNELEYFIETTSTIRPDSSYAMPFQKDYGIPLTVPGISYLVEPARQLKKDLFDNISAYADKVTRISGIQRQMLEPVLQMNKKDEVQWLQMLYFGDENAVEFSTKEMAEVALGQKISQKAWEGYAATRAYYDSVAAVRQRAVYKHLNQNGYKTLYNTEGKVVNDLNGQIHVRPIYEQPSIIARPADNSDELFAPDNVWGKEIYDADIGMHLPLTEDLIHNVYQVEGRTIMRVSREAEFTTGIRNDFIITTPTATKTLSRTPMSIRKGHVDLNYKAQDNVFIRFFAKGNEGGNAFKVDKIGTKILNGEKVASRGAVGIYADLRQATKARQEFINEELAALGHEPTAADIKRIEALYPEPVLTREGLEQFGLDTVGTFGGLPAHSRMRGERLLGPNGQAEAMDIPDSLTKSVAETRRLLGVDAIEVMRRRFAMTYAKHMQNYNGWSADFDTFQWKQSASAVGIHKEARRMHHRIESLDHALSNRDFLFFQKKIVAFANEMINKGGPLRSALGAALRDLSAAQLDNEVKKVVATMLISTRVLFQTLGNLSQISYLLAQSPVVFAKDTIRRSLAMMIASANLRIDSRALDAVGALLSGMDVNQFKQHVKNYMSSGIARSGAAQDMHALLMEAGKIEAGRHNAATATFWKRMVPGLGGVERVSRGLMFPQHVATDIANLFAWNHSFSINASKEGIDKALSRTGARTVAADTRRLTFHQNRTSQFTYQQNWLSMQLMFLQHVHRMYMDLLVDPALRVVSGNKLSVSRDGTNLYADTYAQSLTTLGMMVGIWGAGAYNFGGFTEDEIQQELGKYGVNKEIVSVMLDGLVTEAVDRRYGQEFDVQSRFSPAGALQTTVDLMFGDNGELMIGGPVLHLWKTAEKLSLVKEAAKNATPMEQEVVLDLLLAVSSSALSGTNDIYRATMAANIGSYVDSSGRPLAAVGEDGWIPILFSVQPEAVEVQYDTSSAIRASEDYISEINKLANRMATSMIEENPDNPDHIVAATVKALKALDLLAGNPRVAAAAKEKFLRQQAFDTDGILYRNAEKILGTVAPGKAKELLLELKRVNPEGADMIDQYLKALEDK